MRNPDTVRDDLAFRKLRKDDDSSRDPSQLGIVKDPSNTDIRNHVSCWKHRHERSLSPTVFYPNRNNPLMRSLAERVTQVICSQTGRYYYHSSPCQPTTNLRDPFCQGPHRGLF